MPAAPVRRHFCVVWFSARIIRIFVIGTVTGVSRSAHSPEHIDKVTVRTPEGTQDISATLVIDCIGPAAAGLKWLRHEGYGFADRYGSN
ncbi:hypothetical protein DFS33DRAFT_1310300 [Desarmillaria ectypa]|nr:hypothetical protein DFS33DRAFT_1310300 [Desarmillaria ectypa]